MSPTERAAAGTPSERMVRLDVDDRGIATIAMGDAAGHNAMSEPFVRELSDALAALAACAEARVAVLLGLPEMFSAGASRETLQAILDGKLAPADIVLPRAVLDVPVPVIAAMEGHAVGGGLALGLCADIILIARESSYGCNFMSLGFTPGMGTTRLLEHVLSPAVAHEMMYTGQFFRGSHFEGRSGFNYILPRAQVRPRAMDLAARIADKPRLALETLKRALAADKRQAYEAARATEAMMHAITFAGADVRRLIEENYAGPS
jgi:4-carboxy-3-alkylbut-2-enoyl-[acp] decarboxylase